MLTHGSLFAGIGGFDLGFERAGIKTIWQVEIDGVLQEHLKSHFPAAERFGDIGECGAHNLKRVDIVTGGFPCQPFSTGGKRQNIADDRFLWPEMYRVIRELRPMFVVAENVAGIAHEFDFVLEQVCDDLEAESYETLPALMVPACAFGAPDRRDRVWILAHSLRGDASAKQGQQQKARPEIAGGHLWWSTEPAVGRVADGVPDKLVESALGNAAKPQIAEWIGRRIVAAHPGIAGRL